MFEQNKYNDALAAFKQDFLKRQWPNENYKWEAVQWFQDHWDIEADDFATMLKTSLAKTKNLLLSKNNYPRGMIEELAGAAPEDVRGMFAALFDENADLWTRIDAFKKQALLIKNFQKHLLQVLLSV